MVPAAVHEELWRHRDRKGAYTWLRGSAAVALLRADPDAAEVLEEHIASQLVSPTRVLVGTFDFVEVMCGPRAPLLQAMARQGLRCGPVIDLAVFGMWDVREPRILE